MASAMTTTGLSEFLAATEAFPEALTRALQGVAEATAARIQTRAQAVLQQQVRGRPIEITVRSEPAKHQVRVDATFATGQPTSIPLWFEVGTAPRQQKGGRRTGQIQPLHYMRDSAAAEDAAFRRDLEAVAVATARKVFG